MSEQMVERYRPVAVRLQQIEAQLRGYGCPERFVTKHVEEKRAALASRQQREARRRIKEQEQQQQAAEVALSIIEEERASLPRRRPSPAR
jgi:hypothetical protein